MGLYEGGGGALRGWWERLYEGGVGGVGEGGVVSKSGQKKIPKTILRITFYGFAFGKFKEIRNLIRGLTMVSNSGLRFHYGLNMPN